MSRFWIGLATVLWLGMYAVAADEPSQVPQWFPPAVTGSAGSGTAAAPMPVPAARGSSAESPRRCGRSLSPASAVAPSPFMPARNREPWHTQVWRLRNAPVMQLAQMINTLFNAEQRAGQGDVASKAVIVPDMISNCLIVAGPPEIFDEMRKLIEALDRAPVMIRLEVVMGDVPTADLPAAEAGAKADRDKVRVSAVGVEEARKKMEILFRAN